MAESALERQFALMIRDIETTERELLFAPPRRWRFDFAWPYDRLAVEIEGGVWSGGRHTRGGGFSGDVEKYNAAALLGWTVVRATAKEVSNGTTESIVRLWLSGQREQAVMLLTHPVRGYPTLRKVRGHTQAVAP